MIMLVGNAYLLAIILEFDIINYAYEPIYREILNLNIVEKKLFIFFLWCVVIKHQKPDLIYKTLKCLFSVEDFPKNPVSSSLRQYKANK